MPSNVLVDDHDQLSELLQRLQGSLTEHIAGQNFELLDLFWARLAMHIRAEHLCLFPAILNASRESFETGEMPSFEEASSTVDALRVDHNFFMDELSKAVKLGSEITAKKSITFARSRLSGTPHIAH